MSLSYVAQIGNEGIATDLLNNSMSSDLEMNVKPENLVELGKNMVDKINDTHQFIQQVMQSSHVPSAVEARDIQNKVEEFNLTSQLLSKSVSVAVKDLDTLTRIQ